MKGKNQRKGRGFRVYPVDVFSLLFIFFFGSLFASMLDGGCSYCYWFWLVVASVSAWLKGKHNKQVRIKLVRTYVIQC